jgi:mono/diheme cytochrome c family protein
MPAFEFLAPGERELLVDYVRHLAGIDREPEPEAVATGTETAAGAASVERGKHAYEKMQCGQCHGPAGRGDGPAAKGMKDEMERPIQVRDFSLGFYRRGASAAEIYRTFMAGLDGTPMPSYAASLSNDEAWDLAHYMQTFQKPKAPPPADPLAHARRVVEEKQCTGCHVIEGKGARVGPDLDVSAKKLRFEWAREWLSNPRALGKLYPFTKFRMPDLKLRPDEIEALLRLFAHVAQRPYPDPAETPAALPETDLAKGQLLYVLKCAECHNLGNVIPTPEAKRQGPDLIWANRRLRYDWIPDWVKSPSAVYPGTTMVDTNLSVEEIELIRGFLWKISRDSEKRP